MKKILFVGAEVMPFAATGGLGDVLGSLPAALAANGEGHDIRVVMPLYSAISDKWRSQMKDEAVFNVRLSWRNQYCGVKSLIKDGVTYYFIDNEYYFKRDSLYGSFDDAERYAYFCLAVLEMMAKLDFYPDILHANDWQAAMSVVYLNLKYRNIPGYENIKTIYTIHNIAYQGQYDFWILGDVFGLTEECRGLLELDGCMNLMKAAIECADKVSTVSERYSHEIRTKEYGHGLEGVLNNNAFKLTGILNGIDYDYYNPESDPVLVENYTPTKLSGKGECKLALQEQLGLPKDKNIPVLAVISRLASHKGLDLFCEIAYNLTNTHNIQLIVLGCGESKFEEYFRELELTFPDKVKALIEYDRDLSRKIYAASDIFIMPSKSEPCGLSQMIASRYGSIPVVRETGGLADSIHGFWEKDGELLGNGFTFVNYSSYELNDRICAALELWNDKNKRRKFVKKIMKTDFSWNASACEYMRMYNELS